MTLAWASRGREHITLAYTDRTGTCTRRRLEPYRLVTTSRRWYLLAFDRDRADWRSLRVDRMTDVRAQGSTFAPRATPDPAGYVSRSITSSPYRYSARVRYFCSADAAAQWFSPASATVEADGPDACVVTAGADDPRVSVPHLSMVDADFEILGPPEVIVAARAVADRLRAHAPG